MENTPIVSVIIVNYNGRHFLENCLKSLNQVNFDSFEIILVDNNSSDESVEFVKNNYPEVKLVKLDKNFGFAKPNNLGAEAAKGDFLLFLNNDTKVNYDFISKLINVIEQDPNIAICQSLLLKSDDVVDSAGDFIDTLGRAYSSKIIPEKVLSIFSARGASMLIRKKVFFELGHFDENFFVSFEDVDLGWRAQIAGYKVVVVPDSIVYHMGGKTIEKLKKDIQFHGVKNSLILKLTNFEFSYMIKSISILFFVIFFRRFFGKSVINDPEKPPQIPSISTMFSAIVWVIKNSKYVFKKRNRVNSKRVVSTKKLIEMGLIKKYSFK